MKFDFEMDDIDTENLWSILYTNKMNNLHKLMEYASEGDLQSVKWYIGHIRYLEDMMDTVFSMEMERVNLSKYEEILQS